MLNQDGVDPKQRLEKFTTNMSEITGANNNLKVFDIVFFPILEFSHYYLLVFELKNSAISVIDNFHESIPLVGVKGSADYYLKDSLYKVFMGSWEQFNCGFSTNGKKKICQLNKLRKNILLHIIRSEVNTVRDAVLEAARGV
ncbi:hypothetical protein E3N88_32318 [Mikania micrantha]|uniref:Ubiquitin-like protease family profile domain-containing protein n=1 Tax=Mikania micrantha TaxID=192012 RepID=A0A5N6M837_9ASTR|nr:hypothetical protein E3N88_32318 [Mikania micrantha]